MIKYNLTCLACEAIFNSWFSASEEFERLKKRKLITCIDCNSQDVKKSIMAPNVSSSKRTKNEATKFQKNVRKKFTEYQKFVNKYFKYVGETFSGQFFAGVPEVTSNLSDWQGVCDHHKTIYNTLITKYGGGSTTEKDF